MQNIYLFGIDFHPVFLATSLMAVVAVYRVIRQALPRTPRGW